MAEGPSTPAATGAPGVGSPIWSVRRVLAWLVALTAAEIGVACLPLPRAAVAALLIGGALAKAALVALHFMHLRIERALVVLSLVAATVLALLFVLGLLPDIVFGPGSVRGGG
jgi:caa(3)-type oxidase subunit IV